MMKILFLIPTFDEGGGAEKVLLNLVNNIDCDKYDVTVQTLFDQNAMTNLLNPKVHYKTFITRQFRGNTSLFAYIPAKLLYKLIVKDKYDIVVSYLEGPATRVISGCPYEDTKKIAWIHIELHGDKKFSTGFRSKKSALKTYQDMDAIVCVSKNVKQVFEESAGYKFDNVRVLYNTNETAQIIKKAKESVDDVAFRGDEINVISVAKIMHSKGYDRLAEVHKRLLEDGYRHHIYILGVGEMRERIERYLEENGLKESFTFLGFRDNPYKYVANADVYICSSRVEGFSTAVTESLIVGTPVVSTCCSGARELLGENNEYGIVVENSEEGIYQGMKKMLTDQKLRDHYSKMAAERGKQFSTEKTVKAVEDMLLEVYNER